MNIKKENLRPSDFINFKSYIEASSNSDYVENKVFRDRMLKIEPADREHYIRLGVQYNSKKHVHHINMIKSDNHPDNLIHINSDLHDWLHKDNSLYKMLWFDGFITKEFIYELQKQREAFLSSGKWKTCGHSFFRCSLKALFLSSVRDFKWEPLYSISSVETDKIIAARIKRNKDRAKALAKIVQEAEKERQEERRKKLKSAEKVRHLKLLQGKS
jgi:hypothetical protein